VDYASFRFIAGPVSRYVDAGCAWMIDRDCAGGGCTINLAPHFFDLALLLLGNEARVMHATMGNAAAQQSVEDYSVVTVQAGARTCVIETGYLFPAPTSVFDMHYGIRTKSHYFVAWGPHSLEIRDRQGRSEMLQVSTTNVPHYADFVADVLARSRDGRPPRASLADMVPIMRLVDDAYAYGLTLRELSGGRILHE
jgi:predicted dehydrogenase